MNKNLEVLDILNIISFYMSAKNFDENLSQTKADEILSKAVEDIHNHLNEQDKKIDKILEVLYDKNKEFS